MSYRGEQIFLEKNNQKLYQKGIDFTNTSLQDLKKQWLQMLNRGIHGICFSLYEDGQKPGDTIPKSQVERRIKLIKPYTKWVRSFSCIEGNEYIPQVAKSHGLKTLVGAWLGKNKDDNKKEIKALIELAKKGYVDIAAVGNEVLYRNDFSLNELLDYINEVKNALPNIPVGYVDAYYEFTRHPELINISDIILCNCYPFWEGSDIDHSFNHMQQMYEQVKNLVPNKKVIITETGWPNKGENVKLAFPSENNAMKYFINSQDWAFKQNIDMFYFSSFDESWKISDEGEVGAFWGLWDKNEKLKYQDE